MEEDVELEQGVDVQFSPGVKVTGADGCVAGGDDCRGGVDGCGAEDGVTGDVNVEEKFQE